MLMPYGRRCAVQLCSLRAAAAAAAREQGSAASCSLAAVDQGATSGGRLLATSCSRPSPTAVSTAAPRLASGQLLPQIVVQRSFAAEAAGSRVLVVESEERFKQIMEEHKGGKKVVIDFYAVWCGPCRQISPYFEQLSAAYPGLTFLKVDVDKLNYVAAEASISAVPAFQVWQDGTVVDEFVGASKGDLKALCERHA